MARQAKPPSIIEALIPLSQDGAILLIFAQQARILQGSNHRLVKKNVLQELREKDFLEPLVEIDPVKKIAVSKLSVKGMDRARWMIENNRGYTQMIFDDMVHDQGNGDALSSLVV